MQFAADGESCGGVSSVTSEWICFCSWGGSRFESVKTEIFICSYLIVTDRSLRVFFILVYLSLTIRYCQTTNCKEMSLFGFDWLHLSKQQTIYSYANTKQNAGFKITKLFAWLTHLKIDAGIDKRSKFIDEIIPDYRMFASVFDCSCRELRSCQFPSLSTCMLLAFRELSYKIN